MLPVWTIILVDIFLHDLIQEVSNNGTLSRLQYARKNVTT